MGCSGCFMSKNLNYAFVANKNACLSPLSQCKMEVKIPTIRTILRNTPYTNDEIV